MLIDRYRKQVKRYFWWEKLITEEVAITKEEQKAKRHSKTLVGIDDPTGEFVAHKNSRLKKVTITARGKKIVVKNPEDWLTVIHDTYAMYSRQPIANLIQERIKTKKSVEVLSGFMGISRETYHRWENEFFDDAIFLAAKTGLFKEKNI